MFEERCARCWVRGDKLRLFDTIYEGRACLLCERCAIIENIPIIKKPEQSQLKESEKNVSVYERMKRMAGIKDERKEDIFLKTERLKELEKNPVLSVPVKQKPDMKDYFHWELMRVRRRKGLSQQQLAEAAGVSQLEVEMLEKAKIPDNIETIKKIESFLRIRLRKPSIFEERNDKKPILFDEYGHELEIIPEPEITSEQKSEQDSEVKEEIRDFEIRRADVTNLTIGELKDLHRKRIDATKQEQKEEQRRIEEKQKLIEAKKEELRSLKERESSELDSLLGGSELLNYYKLKNIEESEEESEEDLFFDEEEEEKKQ